MPAEPQAAAPVVTLDEVKACFDRASAAGIKWPKLRFAGFVLSPAGANSVNAGAVYVKTARTDDGEGVYLGKVMNGRFAASRDCDADTKTRVLAVCADPKAAAIAYGKEFGRCSVCARPLTDADSVAAGIGPICAKRYGF